MTRAKDFPGADKTTNYQLLGDIAADEEAIVSAIRSLREREAVSLEEIGFMLGIGPGQISRYLNGNASTTLRNYLRIVRVLGYRCRIVLDKLDHSGDGPTSDQKILPHRVNHRRS